MRLSIAYFISYTFIYSGSGGQHSAVLASLRRPLKLAQHTQPLPPQSLSSPAHGPSVLNLSCIDFKSRVRVRVAIQANSTPQLEEYVDASEPLMIFRKTSPSASRATIRKCECLKSSQVEIQGGKEWSQCPCRLRRSIRPSFFLSF